jgi:hypothetical protein
MPPYDPNERDRVPPAPSSSASGGPEDPVVYPAAEDRRSYVGHSPDDAHRRAAFGRRPSDVPLTYERRSIVPYVIGFLVLVALVPLVMHLGGRDRTAARWGEPDSTATTAAGGEVVHAPAGAKQRFADWAAEGGGAALPQESEENHPYTSQGIRLLADALTEATQGVKIADARQLIDDLRVQADRLQSSPGQDKHSEYAHAAFVAAAKLVGELNDAKHTGADDAGALMTAANAVKPDAPLSPQGEQVRKFFRLAAKGLP